MSLTKAPMPLAILGALTGDLLMILSTTTTKDRHGGDNRGDLNHGSKIEESVENELGHRHPENHEGDHQKRFFKDQLQ